MGQQFALVRRRDPLPEHADRIAGKDVAIVIDPERIAEPGRAVDVPAAGGLPPPLVAADPESEWLDRPRFLEERPALTTSFSSSGLWPSVSIACSIRRAVRINSTRSVMRPVPLHFR
jgi:hypothetical protein